MNRDSFYDDWVRRDDFERLQRERDELLAACKAMSAAADVARADKVDWGAFWEAANQMDDVVVKMSERSET